MSNVVRIAVIGRTEILYNTTLELFDAGYSIACIVTAKAAPEYARTEADFHELAERLGVPFASGVPIANHFELLKKSKADIAVSINYAGIIPQDVIDLFPLGILNAHGGDLPRYRGNACQAWAILNGESSIGLCIHRMIGGELDSGDIIARDHLCISRDTKVTAVWDWMIDATPRLILRAITNLVANSEYVLEKQSKDPRDVLRCYPRTPDDGRINWNCPALDILRLINASNKPYAGAFCEFQSERMVVWDAELLTDEEIFYAVPGQVIAIGIGFIDIACGAGKLRIKNVQVAGKEECTPDDLISSTRKRLT
jgi:UDP-4-amino-4-deoxy-L-arabinose formyltransferase/UDP-glucuronic acid dehydrogenase (UDP-4-keto-hexauronic acid decarboxylating)